jgi:hypothetical protein
MEFMSSINWDEAKRLSVEEGWSNYKIAAHFKVNESSIRRGLKRDGLLPEGEDFFTRMKIEIDAPLRHTGNLAITADWHIPLYDAEYANRFIRTAQERGHKDLLIAGDFFNFDALSAYDPKQHEAGLEKELDEALKVMRVLLDTFDNIYYLWGNHDVRLHRALGFALQFQTAMKLVFGNLGEDALERIRFTNLDHMWVDVEGEQDSWYVCHPANYSRIPLSTARVLASKFNANVITAHSHHCAVGYATDGNRVVAEIGGLFDRSKTAYLQRSTTFPTWQTGYAFLEEGKLIVDSPGWETV